MIPREIVTTGMVLTKGQLFTSGQEIYCDRYGGLPCTPDTFSCGMFSLGVSAITQQQKALYLLRFLSTTESFNISASRTLGPLLFPKVLLSSPFLNFFSVKSKEGLQSN
jgi:hypothetical protein